jgi:FMN-dependent NADH-azoreductase
LKLFEERLPFFDLKLANAAGRLFKGEELTGDDAAHAERLQEYLNGFLDADKVVFSFPMWHLTVPAPLHNYMDYLAQAGQTCRYTAEGSIGLVEDKQVLLIHARGGDYTTKEKAPSEHAVRYMLDSLAFFGINDVSTVILEGHQQYPDRASELIEQALQECRQFGRSF